MIKMLFSIILSFIDKDNVTDELLVNINANISNFNTSCFRGNQSIIKIVSRFFRF